MSTYYTCQKKVEINITSAFRKLKLEPSLKFITYRSQMFQEKLGGLVKYENNAKQFFYLV